MLLTLQGVEPAGENVAFASLVAVPKIRCGIVINHARNVDR
jgi:hypothetical protein